ncbi:putative pterin-binding protein [Chromobacterium violaceum]|uniref:molybdopterin-dependent oxidoreductase n=1 Tax=Chromobacterium violaceum TaxID=536 RepID=UPI001C8C99C8|nr:molybdopterin-dependent oxidoreductase [Chromobacterium violaceum]MBX9265621.1 molybdopterin-dependent oxidoreductase [Chromobacterium violaceum]MCD0493103.1 molybdopterin-dependent oxidoreductase [Chromobacterium violaceum]
MNSNPNTTHRARRGPAARRSFAAVLLLAASLLPHTHSAMAAGVTLTISGNIGKFTNPSAHSYVFSEAEFNALPMREITTATDWTPKGTFRGPLLRELLAKVGAHGRQIKFYGEDNYNVTIPASDFSKYDVILARTWNNQPLQLNDFGPFWVMYPIQNMSTSETSGIFIAKLAWQVSRIEVK